MELSYFHIYHGDLLLNEEEYIINRIELDGRDFPTLDSFYEVFARKMNATAYFGYNLDALFDVLVDYDFERVDRFVWVVNHSADFLREESIEKKVAFYETLFDAANTAHVEPILAKIKSKAILYYFDFSQNIKEVLDRGFLIYQEI
ncbi:MAG: barstar family protein [Chitinophagales bacterium]|jgi:RNAse (barnase) inhibitor barstar|nr:barstar family protein [Chitinophagales bacterium]